MTRPQWPRGGSLTGRVRAALPSLLLATCVQLPLAGPAQGQLTMVLTEVPAKTPAGARIYLAGSFNGWNPAVDAYTLRKSAAGRYTIKLPADIRGPIEFKFTLGSWPVVETDASGNDIENRAFTIPATGSSTWTGTVAGWR